MNRIMLCLLVAFTGATACGAQSGKPITSLPKAPNDPTATAPANATNPDATTAPSYTSPAPTEPIPSLGSDVLTPASGTPSSGNTVQPAQGQDTAGRQPVVTFAQPGQGTATPGTAAPVPQPVTAVPVDTPTPAAAPLPAAPSSSSVPAPVTPDMGPAPLRGGVLTSGMQEMRVVQRKPHFGPGSALGVQLKAGFAGAGIDLATPLAQRLNLRVGASFFNFNGSYDVDGMHIDGDVKFRSATVQLDVFPFGGGFHISPGVTVYNGNNLNANLLVPAGQQFDLGDDSFTSSPDAAHGPPVSGTASMTFGNRTAPSLTIGWGNMIPRSNRHISFPFEIGVQYIKDPQFHLELHGVACGANTVGSGCEEIESDPQYQQDVQQEQDDINNDIHPLRFYPIVSFGVAWAFHIGKH